METPSSKRLQINHQDLLEIKTAPPDSARLQMSLLQVAPGIGAATVVLRASFQGKEISVFAERDLTQFDASMELDPNFPFKKVNVPLFPMSNRLRPTHPENLKLGDLFQATVLGETVTMRLNNQAAVPNAVPHHLHGLLYARTANHAQVVDQKITAEFSHVFEGLWTGQAWVRISQNIQGEKFHYLIEAENTGTTPLPVGFGSHPYFQMPSQDPAFFRVTLPAQEIAEIDDLNNVLPSGRLLPISQDNHRLDFNQAKALPSGVIDNFFLLDPKKPAEILMEDLSAGIRIRFKAMSPNIIGAQLFYPGQGSVLAAEFVTHLPDPRAEIWKQRETGMKLLGPGERAKYEYEISIEPLT